MFRGILNRTRFLVRKTFIGGVIMNFGWVWPSGRRRNSCPFEAYYSSTLGMDKYYFIWKIYVNCWSKSWVLTQKDLLDQAHDNFYGELIWCTYWLCRLWLRPKPCLVDELRRAPLIIVPSYQSERISSKSELLNPCDPLT